MGLYSYQKCSGCNKRALLDDGSRDESGFEWARVLAHRVLDFCDECWSSPGRPRQELVEHALAKPEVFD